MASARDRLEWKNEELAARRRKLYVRAVPVFRKHGYKGATLKALARACGLSIPALYRYFPSKKTFALFPLVLLYPELHGPYPDLTKGDPLVQLAGWIENAVADVPNYLLAFRMMNEIGVGEEERRMMDANIAEHVSLLAETARRAAPHLDDRAARELAQSMLDIAVAPVLRASSPSRPPCGGSFVRSCAGTAYPDCRVHAI